MAVIFFLFFFSLGKLKTDIPQTLFLPRIIQLKIYHQPRFSWDVLEKSKHCYQAHDYLKDERRNIFFSRKQNSEKIWMGTDRKWTSFYFTTEMMINRSPLEDNAISRLVTLMKDTLKQTILWMKWNFLFLNDWSIFLC